MKRLDLFSYKGELHRALSVRENKVLAINCNKIAMPFWLENLEGCEEREGNIVPLLRDMESLSPSEKKKAYERYYLVAPILPFVDDAYMRSQIILWMSEQKGVSKQTIRKYLCQFLVYQDVACLAPQKSEEKPLSIDEKNFRWALNKYYYSPLKHTLKGSYTLMLKERYTTSEGALVEGYPPYHRFRYFFQKTKNMQSFYIARNGLSNYQRNNRPLVGGGVLEFASSIGIGMLDSTILDLYLVNDANELIGRPILTACVDAYSGLCCGYCLTLEGGFYSITQLLHNIIADKVDYCKKFGITISQEEWKCSQLPYTFLTDKGREYTSYALEQLTDLGVNIVNLPPFRPDLKSRVEKFFHIIQSLYKPHLKGKGVIEPDFQERGSKDYRKTACLTMQQFETILLKCIIHYNTKRVVERYPFSDDKTIKPFACEIWNASLEQYVDNLITVDNEMLSLVLLPRDKAVFTRRGLHFRKLYYHAKGFTSSYLDGGQVDVAYNPDDVSVIYVIDSEGFTPFRMIDSQYQGVSFNALNEVLAHKEQYLKAFEREALQAKISLIQDIEDIASNTRQGAVTTSVRKARSKEKERTRRGS